MRRAAWDRSKLRTATLVAAGVVCVHELRYLIGHDGSAAALAALGHGYIGGLKLMVAGLMAVAAAHFVGALARGRGSSTHRGEPVSALWLWLRISGAILALYLAQESLESLVAVGHVVGPVAGFSHGGWVAVPAALAVGKLVTLLLIGAGAAIAALGRGDRSAHDGRARMRSRLPADVYLPRAAVMALMLGGRAPPPATA